MTKAELLETGLLQACFIKPYHQWSDEEKGAYWRYQERQNKLSGKLHPIPSPEQCPTIQPKPKCWRRLWMAIDDFLRYGRIRSQEEKSL